MRHYSAFDQIISQADHALRTVLGKPGITERPDPSAGINESKLSDKERKQSAGLMRVNHAGEVSAQALYQGQALTARLEEVRSSMERAALEENDHLVWTEKRLEDLGDHKSFLNPLWYTGSFALGAFAGAIGDKWSLGFVAETEHQVIRHLDEHLQKLPASDARSKAILQQMKEDEAHHATIALEGGGAELPWPVKKIMQAMSKVMTTTSYYI
ncbi:MAG: 2-polyprenyl-3-methyl-6-methoxy-1,4-benzoquinone monooxygenase [Gammaproteobacteria bacterium]|nr:2-polyprenyl-3-methyl-6-methoxy-1,4-benzoquinone monooxygenase [Gammaproteobacteria bacterium]MCW8910156.1 2-polyprenyl-3-methyl-6-methoxy-1,4-benzoquinone monooxygenase [Gammaproteobacteria bacterium]MCW9006154.1 2-polyprenyl-3-methyl-6-methoxy-1,4-benzoquinone monooxygenase [Gammaproteobacteria bacterium]MCW9055442.1 2-polyprenyl-3-methyl-6-methoxy-1,4-benzoquinone monooxygenase [Gammaproteobacteria bacterium]